MIDILERLIAINTTTAHDTFEAVECAKGLLDAAGARTKLVPNALGTRAGLVATIGDPGRPGVILSGHLDTVPATPAEWQSDPWVLTDRDGKLCGRGTSDMKGAIAVALSLAPEFAKAGKTVHFALSHDEEVGALSINDLIAEARTEFPNAAGCIVMEPTANKIVIGGKTATDGSIEVYGRAAHSSNPSLGDNAIAKAVEIYKIFYDTLREFQGTRDTLYTVPHAIGDICEFRGGEAVNTIPARAEMTYLVRFLDGAEQEKFLVLFDKRIAGFSAKRSRSCNLPGFNTAIDDPFVARILKHAELAAVPKVSYGTEAGHFAALGIPTVVMGPGDIARAHAIDEWVGAKELEDFARILRGVI